MDKLVIYTNWFAQFCASHIKPAWFQSFSGREVNQDYTSIINSVSSFLIGNHKPFIEISIETSISTN